MTSLFLVGNTSTQSGSIFQPAMLDDPGSCNSKCTPENLMLGRILYFPLGGMKGLFSGAKLLVLQRVPPHPGCWIVANTGLVVRIPQPKNVSCHPEYDWHPGWGGRSNVWTCDQNLGQ